MDARCNCSPSLRALAHNNKVIHSSIHPNMLPALLLMKSAAIIPNARLSYTTYTPQYFNLCNCGSYLIEIKHEAEIIKCVEEKSLVFKSYSNETRFFPKTTLTALSEY